MGMRTLAVDEEGTTTTSEASIIEVDHVNTLLTKLGDSINKLIQKI